MCGRFALSSSTDQLIREFVSEGGKPEGWRPGWEPRYSIAPTNEAPVVRTNEGARELERATWDWPKPANRPKGAPIINARIEKLMEPFWRTGFTRSRCLVPMTGYFEWTGEKGDKTPHYIHGTGLLAAAGMTRLVDGEPRFVVVTREGRDAAGEIHARMPAFLPEETWDDWLSDSPGDSGLQQLLVDASDHVAATLHSRIVDRRVNSVRSADPRDASLIEAVV